MIISKKNRNRIIFFFLIFISIILLSIFYFNKKSFKEKYKNIEIIQENTKLNEIQNKNKYKNDEKYTAIIIEPRKHSALEFVLTNFLLNLSDNWNIIIFHGNKNINFVNNILRRSLYKYKNRITTFNQIHYI